MKRNTITDVGAKRISAEVINLAYNDLVKYRPQEQMELERQIRRGTLDIFFDLLNMPITTKELIEKARRKRIERGQNDAKKI